jgi:hypothetical protein
VSAFAASGMVTLAGTGGATGRMDEIEVEAAPFWHE